MNIYVSGGSKCGKSDFAENLAKAMSEEMDLPLYYVATMIPKDNEDLLRVDKHRKMRKDKGFQTLELKTPEDIGTFLPYISQGVFLIDSVTAILENTIFDENYSIDENGWRSVTDSLIEFMDKGKNLVFVSDFIYSDGVEYDQYTEIYRKNLALCDRRLAEKCDQVWEVTFGCPLQWK